MSSESQVSNVEDLTVDEWLSLIFDPSPDAFIPDHRFPTDRHLDEYISTIQKRSDNEIRRLLLRFLVQSGAFGIDKFRLEWLLLDKKGSPERFAAMMNMQFYRRLVTFASGKSTIPPWEGITWVIDLLPHFPKQALDGLSSYILAHIPVLPDERLDGLHDAEEIIRAKYIGTPSSQAEKIRFLNQVSPREFEHIIERLYSRMGYTTILTPTQKDGGRDIIAKKEGVGTSEHLLVECKQYNRPVNITIIRALLGVVADEKVNKGVLVATSRFTKAGIALARQNPRLELISGESLIPLLNEHLGARWINRIERIVSESRHENQ